MKKNTQFSKFSNLAIQGFFIGIIIGNISSIIISLIYGEGNYTPVHPDVINMMGNEINAVILQTLLSGFIGISFATSSVIWENANLSTLSKTSLYFFINLLTMLIVAFLLKWTDFSFKQLIYFISTFTLIFISIWFFFFFIERYKVKKMNRELVNLQENNK